MKVKFNDDNHLDIKPDDVEQSMLTERGQYYIDRIRELQQTINDCEYDIVKLKRAMTGDSCKLKVGDVCLTPKGVTVKITEINPRMDYGVFSGFNGKCSAQKANGEFSKAQVGLSCYEFSQLKKID